MTETPQIDEIAFQDALDDVHTRFVLNLPAEELASADRIFFQIEQAWWFYEDMICDRLDPCLLPRFSSLKPFALKLFEYSPLLQESTFPQMWAKFGIYKRKISTYGTILLNPQATHVILCQTWNGDTWTFPAGKINQGESGREAAARETFEETGFDPHCEFGLTKEWLDESSQRISWACPLDETSGLSYQEQDNGKRRTCYVCVGVPMDFPFMPVARKEISDIQWFPIDELPKKTYAVLPFMGKVRGYLRKKHKKSVKKQKQQSSSRPKSRPKSNGRDGNNKGRSKSNPKASGDDRKTASKGRSIQNEHSNLVQGGLATIGDMDRWSEEDMFKANEALLGRKVDYDGNPHVFAEQGFGGNDPHAFRVVGGSFMNSGEGLSNITKNEQTKKYQKLVNESNDEDMLTPFFASDGTTPWGEVVEEVKNEPTSSADAGTALLAMLHGKTRSNSNTVSPPRPGKGAKRNSKAKPPIATTAGEDDYPLDVMTDAQITANSQARHQQQHQATKNCDFEDDVAFLKRWVANLPNPVNFKIQNLDAIMEKHFGPNC